MKEGADSVPSVITRHRPNWLLFGLICASYVAATAGEQSLGPIFPETATEFGLSEIDGGLAFGVLAISIAVMNLVGGLLLSRFGPKRMIVTAAATSVVGAMLAATANAFPQLVVAQVLLGGGAGLFFPAGLQSAGIAAGTSRRGYAMGIYGVAYSLGLAFAAGLGAIGSFAGWRYAFGISAGLSAMGLVAALNSKIPSPPPTNGGSFSSLRKSLSIATAVGAVGTMCQYGSISFLTTYAVQQWNISTAQAAMILGIGRLISIVAKLVSGSGSDRIGPHASARYTGIVLVALGLMWVLAPPGIVTYIAAAVFAGIVSSLGPIANMLAVNQFGGDGIALGAFRSLQIAVGALAGVLIGVGGERFGLKPVLAIAMVLPASLLWICRERA